MTLTDLLVSGLQGRKEEDYLKEQIKSMKEEMHDLTQKHLATTGKKLTLDKRVSFKISTKEFKILNMASARQNISKSALLHDLVFPTAPTKETPALKYDGMT